MKVPFLDLGLQVGEIVDESLAAIREVIQQTAFAGGPMVQAFENQFAEYCGAGYCVGVASGTAALELTLTGLEIGAGDDVLLQANTFIAAAEAVARVGARPVLVDVDDSANLDVTRIEAAMTPASRAIIATHLYGQPAAMQAIREIAGRRELIVVEDSAQAHGASYLGQRCGGLADAAAFSFYPSKNLGAWGEGGCVTTDNAELAQRVRMLADHGSSHKYHHQLLGSNQRMDGMQAAVLSVSLKRLDAWNRRRQEIAERYRRGLQDAANLRLIQQNSDGQSVYHLFVIRTNDVDRVRDALRQAGVQTGRHYPTPIHLQPAFAYLGYAAGDFPVTEQMSREILSLPMFPQLSDEQVDYVVEALLRITG